MQNLSGNRFALIAKTHHALVDGISGVDITTVLFDTAREPVPTGPPSPWSAQPLPGQAKLLGEALLERGTVPNEMMRGARALLRAPRRAVSQVREGLVNVGATTLAGVRSPAPAEPVQRRDRPAPPLHVHRRRPRALQSDQGLARRNPERRRADRRHARARALPAPPGHRHRGPRAEGDGPGVGAHQGPARSARQPGRCDVGAAARRHPVAGRGARPRSRRRWRT